MRRHRSDERGQRGAAIVEFAFIAPVLLLVFCALIDLGDGFFRSTAVVDALRASGVTSFDSGADRQHDLRTLETLVNELDNRRVDGVKSIIFFDASDTDSVPPECLTFNAIVNWGVPDTCVVYSDFVVDLVRSGDLEKHYKENCAWSYDRQWCAPDRDNDSEDWWVGIHVVANQKSLTGILPWFNNYTIERTVVVKEAVRD